MKYIKLEDIMYNVIMAILDCPPSKRGNFKLVIGQDFFGRIRKEDLSKLSDFCNEFIKSDYLVEPFVDGIYLYYDKFIVKHEEIKLNFGY